MPTLILIKHARPDVMPAVPSRDWTLSDEGRDSCKALAARLAAKPPDLLVTSDEPKAIETGSIVAGILKKPVQAAEDLHEHDRSNVPLMDTREFLSRVALFFKKPDELVLGLETATQALRRFSDAVERVVTANPGQTIGIVSHGTVIALLAAQRANLDGYQLWRQMGLPSFLVFSLPAMGLIERVDRLADKRS